MPKFSVFNGLFALVDLNLPAYEFRIREEENVSYIFDTFRKKFIVWTREEWVRQHLLRFLVEERNVPPSLIAIEREIRINRLSRRFDALVFDAAHTPRMLIECKAPEVKITQDTIDQVTAYNLRFKVEYLLLSNGIQHLLFRLNPANTQYESQPVLPNWGAWEPAN